MSEDARNYGDERILEFDRLAADWENANPDPLHPRNHINHAERWRKKAAEFRAHHARDPYWSSKEELFHDARHPPRERTEEHE